MQMLMGFFYPYLYNLHLSTQQYGLKYLVKNYMKILVVEKKISVK